MRIKHPLLMIAIAIHVGIVTWALQHTAYREPANHAISVACLIASARIIYRNIKTGQYRLPHRH